MIQMAKFQLILNVKPVIVMKRKNKENVKMALTSANNVILLHMKNVLIVQMELQLVQKKKII